MEERLKRLAFSSDWLQNVVDPKVSKKLIQNEIELLCNILRT